MAIDSGLRRDITKFLIDLPLLQNKEGRQATLLSAGLQEALPHIDLSGSPYEFVARLIERLETYTTLSDGQFALICFLQEIGNQLGQDHQETLRIWCEHLQTQLKSRPIVVFKSQRPITYLAPFQAPPLPGHFVSRPEVTDVLKVRLLKDDPSTPGILVVSAIHGLGGIGKSTLAAALAYDKDVQERFPDGILWATLGQQPEILSLISGWIHEMRDYDFRPTTIEAASAHLRTLLQDKAVLLVVDDVWNPEHAIHFKVGGPCCQVLITTRRADVADEVGAELHQMDVMTPEQSLDLLAARLQRPLEATERDEALSLAEAVGYLRPFPSLALRVNGNHRGLFETHAMWASHADMEAVFFAGEAQQHLISQIQADISSHEETPVHLHIWGEPGIGKTRLVLETTDTETLRPSVIYCRADNFINSELMSLLQQGTYHALLVLDACDPQSRKEIWNKLKCHSPRIRLVSISDEPMHEAGLHSFKIPPLEEEQIKAIIQSYGISDIRAGHWARVCEGSPKVAHVIGQQVKMDSADILTSLDDIWERYIAGSDDRQSHAVEQRRRVLRYLSLFTRFGYGRPVDDEALTIWKMIAQADQTVTWAIFQEIIHDLQRRNILQGTHTLHITPKLLHITLWLEWWNLYGERFPVDTLFDLPDSLRDWAFEMFEYASGSQAASRCVKELLGPQGVFQQHPQHLSTASGARLFWVLTKAEPEAALRCLHNIPETWRKEAFSRGSANLIWALEEMAIRKDLFADAARFLLEVADFEGESRSNHASGVFVGLFYVSLHPELSRTEASPQERFPIIKEAFESDSKKRRKLALWACERALRHDFAGTVIETEGVVGKKRQLWKPETYGEIFDAYRQVWLYLSHNLERLPEDERREASEVLLRTAHQISRIESLTEMVIETIEELAKKSYTDKERLLDDVMWILRHEKLSDDTRQRWEQIRQNLTGADFPSLFKRYVGMSVFEDNFDEEGNQTNLVQDKIEELAQQAISHQELFQAELYWLMTTKAKKGYYFGYALGQRDVLFSLLPNFLQAQQAVKENECKAFLGGYLRALFEQDYPRWERFLERLTADAALNTWVPELTWRSGRLDDASALRILKLVEAQVVDIRQLPVYAQGVQDLSEDVITQWIELSLADPDDTTLAVALHLVHDYYLREPQHRLPEELMLRVLTHPTLLQQPEKGKRDPSFNHIWKLITKAFIQQYPQQRGIIADFLFEHLGEKTPIFGGIFSSVQVILLEMIRQYPEEIWERIAHSLETPYDQRAYELQNWLKGYDFPDPDMGSGAILPMFPMEAVWQWIDEHVKERAPYFAEFIPKELFRDEKNPCWMREFLARYGDDKSVRKCLLESFYSYGWSGLQSLYLQNKKQEILDFKQGEENAHVRRWIDEYVAVLEQEIEYVSIQEERKDF